MIEKETYKIRCYSGITEVTSNQEQKKWTLLPNDVMCLTHASNHYLETDLEHIPECTFLLDNIKITVHNMKIEDGAIRFKNYSLEYI